MSGLHVFTLAGVPVFISLWYVALLAFWTMRSGLTYGLLWAGAVTVSLLVHEFGHALVARHFRLNPQVILHGWGGLTGHDRADRDRDDALIIAAGPGAGLALGAILYGATFAVARLAPQWFGTHPLVMVALQMLIEINIFWSLLNLVPFWPLDGGQLFRLGLLQKLHPARAEKITHIVGLACGVVGAVIAYRGGYLFVTIICALLAWENVTRVNARQTSGAIRNMNRHAKGLLGEARQAFADGDWREAARLCHQIRAEPSLGAGVLAQTWEILGIATERMGEPDEAMSYLERAQDTPGVVASRVRALVALERKAAAREAMRAPAFGKLPTDTRSELEQLVRTM